MRDYMLGDDDDFDQLYGPPVQSVILRCGQWKNAGDRRLRLLKADKDGSFIVEWKPIVDLTRSTI